MPKPFYTEPVIEHRHQHIIGYDDLVVCGGTLWDLLNFRKLNS